MGVTVLIAIVFYLLAFASCHVTVARKEKALRREGIDKESPEGIAYTRSGRNLKQFFPTMVAGMALCNGLPLPDDQKVYPAILLILGLGVAWWRIEKRIAEDEAAAKDEQHGRT